MLTAETYNNVEKMIHKICWSFANKYGEDFEECLSVANESFCKAYESHDSSRGKLTTFVWSCVLNGLRNNAKKKNTKTYKTFWSCNTDEENARATWDDEFPFEHFTRGLSDDASKVIELICDSKDDVAKLVENGGKVGVIKALSRYLSNIGWSVRQIAEAFTEVRSFVNR